MVIGLSEGQFGLYSYEWLTKSDDVRVAGVRFVKFTSMIAKPTGRREVLLPINHNYNKICDILGFFLIKTQEISRFLQAMKKAS